VNIDLLKRPAIFGTIIGVLVIALIWWFAWMSPEANKLANVNSQATLAQTQITQLTATVASLKEQSALLPSEVPYLAHFEVAIPNLPESGVLTSQLAQLAHTTGSTISSLSDATVVPSGAYSVIPVSIVIGGTHNGIEQFIKDIYTMPRLLTISSISLTPPGTQPDLNKSSNAPGFSATISADAYTTFIPPTVTP
jgi:type IV pilus assembly protein PilO